MNEERRSKLLRFRVIRVFRGLNCRIEDQCTLEAAVNNGRFVEQEETKGTEMHVDDHIRLVWTAQPTGALTVGLPPIFNLLRRRWVDDR